MLEYSTKGKKKRERIVLAVSLALGACSFGFSMIPKVMYPMLYQLLAVLCFGTGVWMLIRYLMRDYIFRISLREDGKNGLPDFTVTESYGKKRTVVCRVSVEDVLSVEEVTKENRRALKAKQKGKDVYVYTGEMRPPKLYLLTLIDGETTIFLYFYAEEAFVQALKNP